MKAQRELEVEIARRKHVDNNVHQISNLLFGEEKGCIVMVHVRAPGQPLVDDWDCLKTLVSMDKFFNIGIISIFQAQNSYQFLVNMNSQAYLISCMLHIK